jgi:hypothetical protein
MEYLFAKYRMHDVINAIIGDILKRVNQLTSSSFDMKSIEQIAAEIFEENKLITPVLDESNQYQRDPKDVTINIPTRSRYSGYSPVAGTKFEIIVPFTGDKDLFDMTPSAFSSNIPYATISGNELRFTYEVPVGRDKKEVYEDYQRNLENIKHWLKNIDNDVTSFNSKLKGEVVTAVTNRKKKIDDDNNAANSSGIPIR